MSSKFKHVYGPVPSRRLGRSLGVDGLTFKTCTFDCVYCQLGHTTDHTIERKEYVPSDEIIAEIARKLENGDKPDYISFAGSGEPTLHKGLGKIIAAIKAMSDIPVAVFTNGSLLWMPEVCADLAQADLLVPSLDAGNGDLLYKVNNYVAPLRFEQMLDGLYRLRDNFPGQIWLEVMLLAGISDDDAAVQAIAEHSVKIRPDKVQINTVCRPPAESFAKPIAAERLLQIQSLFASIVSCPVEIVAEHLDDLAHTTFQKQINEKDVLATIERRPCTAAGLAAGLNIHITEAIKHLDMLIAADKVVILPQNGENFYFAKEPQQEQE